MNRRRGRPGWDGPKTRGLILEAMMDLPLGASLREVAARIGRHENTVRHHVARMKKTGHVQVVKRGYAKRQVVVPVRAKLSETEAEWLKLGSITARTIVVVARAGPRRVSSGEVAKVLGWHHAVTRYHLQRAREAGILEARQGAGYTLALGDAAQREFAGLHPRAFEAVQLIQREGRRMSSGDVARALGWNVDQARYHLQRAARAGLLYTRKTGAACDYALSSGAVLINWRKSDIAPA